MSFSEAEVQSARGAWEKMYVDAEDNGTAVLVRMFTEHPDTKSYFTHFKGMDSAEEMKQSDHVRGHGKRVFTAINDMVQHLDNTEAFLGILNPLGQKHATQLKIDPKNFRVSYESSSRGKESLWKKTNILNTYQSNGTDTGLALISKFK
uniref:superoxide dismutase n=1 Tax=Pavo cristatus TaxID=9049 RepID=A0A8C9EPP6_PAVCR